MRSLAVVVPRTLAESTRKSLIASGALRTDLRIERTPGEVAFPIQTAPASIPENARMEEREFREVAPGPSGGYREAVDIEPARLALLPRAFDVVGDIVLIRLPPELSDDAPAIGRALLEFVPGARLVAWDRGVHGANRVRRLERIAGAGGFRTLHRENGLEIQVDLEVAYFSPRLSREHARVAEQVTLGERMGDLCCGVGPFSLTIARDGRAASVTAVDHNPDAIDLLIANLERLALPGRVRPICTSLEAFLAEAGVLERVVFNLPHEGIKYLPLVFNAVAPGGTLHYYEVTERVDRGARGEVLTGLAPRNSSWSVGEAHVVHPYSPSSDLIAYALERRK